MKFRWKILIAAGVVLVLVAASLMVTLRVQPQGELEAYKKLLRDQGEKLDLSEILPPPVPPESNSVNAVEDAFRMFGSGMVKIPNAMKMVAPGKAMVGWNQPEACGYDFTNSWDEFGAEIEASRPAIELLHQVLERPNLDFQLDYTKGPLKRLPQFGPMKIAAQELVAATILELHNGDAGTATTNVLTLLALIHRDTRDELLISHLVRMALLAISFTPTWELLQATNVTDVQFAAVQNGWQQMNFLNDAENSFIMERVWTSDEIQKTRASHEEYKGIVTFPDFDDLASGGSSWEDILKDATKGPRLAASEAMWRSSWSYSAELRTLKNQQIILTALRAMQTNRSQFYKADYDVMTAHLSSLGLTNPGAAFFRALRIPDIGEIFDDQSLYNAVRKTLQTETAQRIVVTAIALKRFQLKRGKWPDTLSELVPELLPSVPIDPYDGKSLKYHPNADGTYLLYSVAADGVDDGGDPTDPTGGSLNRGWQNPKARDWVWPQPASPAEVQDFYEHPPK